MQYVLKKLQFSKFIIFIIMIINIINLEAINLKLPIIALTTFCNNQDLKATAFTTQKLQNIDNHLDKPTCKILLCSAPNNSDARFCKKNKEYIRKEFTKESNPSSSDYYKTTDDHEKLNQSWCHFLFCENSSSKDYDKKFCHQNGY